MNRFAKLLHPPSSVSCPFPARLCHSGGRSGGRNDVIARDERPKQSMHHMILNITAVTNHQSIEVKSELFCCLIKSIENAEYGSKSGNFKYFHNILF